MEYVGYTMLIGAKQWVGTVLEIATSDRFRRSSSQ